MRSAKLWAASLAPTDGAIQLAVGMAWKWEWLASTDTASLSKATRCLIQAAKLLPRDPGPRLELAAISLVRGNVSFASLATRSALFCDREAALPLVALVAGLVLIHTILNDIRASDVAEVDAALLTDDLPPAAYADPGFVQFLKAGRE